MQKKKPTEKFKEYLERIFLPSKGRWIAFKAYERLKKESLRLNLRDFVDYFTDVFVQCNNAYIRKYKLRNELRKALLYLDSLSSM